MFKSHKIFTIFFTLLFISCTDGDIDFQEVCDKYLDDMCEIPLYPPESSYVVMDNSPFSQTNEAILDKTALNYINQSMRYATALTYDKDSDIYGEIVNGEIAALNDSLMYHSMQIATMCLIEYAIRQNYLSSIYTVQSDLERAWEASKQYNIHSSGTFHRHTTKNNSNTSVSRDGMAGYFYMAAVVKLTNCEPVNSEIKPILKKAKEYGQSNDWEMGVAGLQSYSTSNLRERHPFRMVLNLHDQDYGGMSLATSLYSPKNSTRTAEAYYYNSYYCSIGYPENCIVVAGHPAVYTLHLTMLTTFVAFVEAKLRPHNSILSLEEVQGYWRYMQMLGSGINQINWKSVVLARVANGDRSYNDVTNALIDIYPANHIPRKFPSKEYSKYFHGKCIGADFLWQRIPLLEQSCTAKSPDENILFGIGFLEVWIYAKIMKSGGFN